MAFSERIRLLVDVVTGSSSGSLKKLSADVSAADGAFGKMKVGVKGMTSMLATAGPAAALAAGTALAGFAVKAVGDFQDVALAAGETRDALGVTAEEASQLNEVAADLGIPIDTLVGAIGRMNRAAATTPEAFDGIGASIVRSADGAIDVTATFQSTAEAISKIPDAAARAAAGQKIFGRGWMQISELIMKGADGIAEAMKMIEDGKVVSDDQIAEARSFRDTLDELRGVAESLSAEVGATLVPVLDQLAGALAVVAKVTGPLSTAFDALNGNLDENRTAVDKAIRYLNPVTGVFNSITDSLTGLNKEWNDFRGEVSGSLDPTWVGPVTQALADAEESARLAAQAHEEYVKRMDGSAVQAAILARETLNASAATEEAVGPIERVGEALGDAADEADALASSFNLVFGEFLSMEEAAAQVEANIDDLRQSMRQYGKTLDITTESGRANRDQVAESVKGIGTYAAALKGTGATNREVRAAVDDMTVGLVGQLVQFGLTESEARDYLGTLGLTPANVDTAIRLYNKEQAKGDVLDYKGAIDSVPGSKSTTVSTPGIEEATSRAYSLRDAVNSVPATRNITFNVSQNGIVPGYGGGPQSVGGAQSLGAGGGLSPRAASALAAAFGVALDDLMRDQVRAIRRGRRPGG